MDVRLLTNSTKILLLKQILLKLLSKAVFILQKTFNRNLVEVYKIKEKLTLNRSAYVVLLLLQLHKGKIWS